MSRADPTSFMCRFSGNSASLNLLQPQRAAQSCNGAVLPFIVIKSESKQSKMLKYEIIYQLDAIEYSFVFFQLDMFRAYGRISPKHVELKEHK